MIDPTTALAFTLFENKGVFALLLGSGISRAAHIPTGWEITLDLVRRVARMDGVAEQPDWAAWYRDKYKSEPNYSKLLDSVSHSPGERRAILHSYIEPTREEIEQGRKVPTKAHRAIARLARDGFIRVMITTNFDRLLENALKAEGIEPSVIKSDDDVKGAMPVIHSACYLLKLHGDYLDMRIRNTEDELKSYSSVTNALLDRIFDEHGLIVCGWSGEWDDALRAAVTRAPSRRYPMFWASRSAPTGVAAELVALRDGNLVPISDAESFFEVLQHKVELQETMRRPDPRSVDLLIASAKQYLSRAEYRIQLSELVAEEVRRLQEQVADAKFGPQGPWSVEEFRKRVARYQSITEPLARLFGVLGRWGTGDENGLAYDVLQTLWRRPAMSGLTALIELQDYPAVLIFVAYALGLIKANRYLELYQWFSLLLDRENDERRKAIEVLFLGNWAGGKAVWQSLEGLEKRNTPLSDYLHSLFKIWGQDYMIGRGSLGTLFAEYEILGALAFLTLQSSKKEVDQALGQTGQRNYLWFPVGRSAWDAESRNRVFADLKSGRLRGVALQAGFAQGDAGFLDSALENLGRFMSLIEWRL